MTDNKLLQTVGGGVTSIVEISKAVSAGEMTETSAENLLMTVFKMTKKEASKLIEVPVRQVSEDPAATPPVDTGMII